MNLPVHIITCQTPSMNLPAHGTTSPDPSKASLSVKNNTHSSQPATQAPGASTSTAWRNRFRPPGDLRPTARRYGLQQNLAVSRPPGGYRLTAGHQPLQTPFLSLRPPGALSPAARRCDSTIPVMFSSLFPSIPHYPTPSKVTRQS